MQAKVAEMKTVGIRQEAVAIKKAGVETKKTKKAAIEMKTAELTEEAPNLILDEVALAVPRLLPRGNDCKQSHRPQSQTFGDETPSLKCSERPR